MGLVQYEDVLIVSFDDHHKQGTKLVGVTTFITRSFLTVATNRNTSFESTTRSRKVRQPHSLHTIFATRLNPNVRLADRNSMDWLVGLASVLNADRRS